MSYIVRKKAKFKIIAGYFVNFPYKAELTEDGDLLFWNGKPACMRDSQNAKDYLSWNGDGCGVERGKLIDGITDRLIHQGDDLEAMWERIYNDPMCCKYRREDCQDVWIWNNDFYRATILELQHIAHVTGVFG